ncbi:hypothetical protein [Staphylococcus aureus]|nr:hypothetical protein [Staphylococcus aureus]MCJ8005701.1 hypothetical protein [Staphylococcus aureus]MCJ8032912.1 hypothetical protein [Staphylococcus aureus]
MKALAWIVAALLIAAALHAVDWSFATAIALIGVAVLLLAWIASGAARP